MAKKPSSSWFSNGAPLLTPATAPNEARRAVRSVICCRRSVSATTWRRSICPRSCVWSCTGAKSPRPRTRAKVAARCLLGSKVLEHGRRDRPLERPDFGNTTPVLLFPADSATPLSAVKGPVTLVVPDGTWTQAIRMGRRIPWIADLPRVALPESDDKTTYLLRSSERPGGLGTMEAIARAFGILEGADVQAKLDHIFRLFVERTLAARGQQRQRITGPMRRPLARSISRSSFGFTSLQESAAPRAWCRCPCPDRNRRDAPCLLWRVMSRSARELLSDRSRSHRCWRSRGRWPSSARPPWRP